jgi:biotin-dependent carboxylase-like uncharacterized protein
VIEVLAPGLRSTVQDLGRAGWAALGVSPSGALDRPAHLAAQRQVGNDDGAAGIECTGGGLVVRPLRDVVICVTGAACAVLVDGRDAGHGTAVPVAAGQVVAVGPPSDGWRSYLAVGGGVVTEVVLGSRSCDTLGHVGGRPLASGDVLPVGDAPTGLTSRTAVPPSRPADVVRVWPGPRADRLVDALVQLTQQVWRVAPHSDRVGLRLDGTPLQRHHAQELASEGMVTGAVQVPHGGHPIVMLADHPTTGGYPVVGVVDPDDIAGLAQLRPGDLLRFRPVAPDGG